MRKFITYFLSLMMIVFFVVGCSEESSTEPDGNGTNNPPSYIGPGGVFDGVLVAIFTASVIDIPGIGPQAVQIGTATAFFYSGSNNVNAGTVSVDGEDMTYNSGIYIYTPDALNPTGLSFGNPSWNVAGGNGIPAFNYTTSNGMPSITSFQNSSTTVDVSSDYTLGLGTASVNLSDSLYFGVYGPSGNLYITKARSQGSSHTFTAAEMATVGKGAGYVQIAAYRFQEFMTGGKNFAFVNEGVLTQAVTLQ